MYRFKTVADKARPLASVTFRTLAQKQFKYQTVLRPLLSVRQNIVRNYAAPVAAEPFLNGSSSVYVEEMYNAWLQDPNTVHKVSPTTSSNLEMCNVSKKYYSVGLRVLSRLTKQ